MKNKSGEVKDEIRLTLADKMLVDFQNDLTVAFQGYAVPVYFMIEKYLKIVDKNGKCIDFELNRQQIELYKAICIQKRSGKPIRQNVLKSRQIGFSTLIAGIFFVIGMFTPNMSVGVVADIKDHAQNIFKKYEFFYDHLDDNNPNRAEIEKYARENKGALHPYSYKPTLKARRGQAFLETAAGNSIIEVVVAGESSGRSGTYQLLHLSEAAFFMNLKVTMNGLLETVSSNNLNSMIFIETTANGFNEYKERWDKDVVGKTAYNAFFVPWFTNPEYIDMTYEKNPDKELPLFEEWFYEKINAHSKLSKAQLMWYWNKYQDKGDRGMTLQEYPFSPTDAFLQSGNCIFGAELIARRKDEVLKEQLLGVAQMGIFTYVARFSADGSRIELKNDEFREMRNGAIKIYKKPIYNHPYVGICDPNNGGTDDAAIQIVDNHTGEQVAVMYTNEMDHDKIAYQFYLLGKMYNTALLSNEMNVGKAVMDYLIKLSYPRLYVNQKQVFEDFRQGISKKFGHLITKANRPFMIESLKIAFRENPRMINDYETLSQMESFQRIERTTALGKTTSKVEATSGNKDDLVMSLAGFYLVREQQTALLTEDHPIIDKKFKDIDAASAYVEGLNRRRNEPRPNKLERVVGIRF
ncbi:MAG: hypothetical protein M0Q41_10770 [Bacteroidales bacterium]|nr:hypothetical protein [Bacteroidales bacterium]